MRIPLDGLTVFFPYDYVYPEQYDYMLSLKKVLDGGKGHCLLEMPTGTGKTVSLLSLIVSYQMHYPETGKLVYCTRTVQEMDKVMVEVKRVFAYIESEIGDVGAADISMTDAADIEDIEDLEDASGLLKSVLKKGRELLKRNLCVCLSSRRNLCVHPEVGQFEDRSKVDALCRDRTASWIRQNDKYASRLCKYFEGYESLATDMSLKGIYSLSELKRVGLAKGWCPYFLARRLLAVANIVVYNYQYLLDPRISKQVSGDLGAECIVVFDEAHNIDNICVEALSVRIDKGGIEAAQRNLQDLERRVAEMQRIDGRRLDAEYRALVAGLRLSEETTDVLLAAPVLDSGSGAVVPGNIRKARNFVSFLQTCVEYLKRRMDGSLAVTTESCAHFVASFARSSGLRPEQVCALEYSADRLLSLLRTLCVERCDVFNGVSKVCQLATVVGCYKHSEAFRVLLEPFDTRTPGIRDPLLRVCCLDASIAMKPVLDKFRNVIITSGTLSPLDFYPKMLRMAPRLSASFQMTVSRPCICPLIVCKGNDQMALTSRFAQRRDQTVLKNYGELLRQMAATVADGIVCFFTSYCYMEEVVAEWSKLGILKEIMTHKLLFVETKDVIETTLALDSYKKCCDYGRGAVFLSVARGKIAEGIDFDSHYGRCVLLFGVPFQYSLSRTLRLRLEFLRSEFGIAESAFLSFDALRQAAQCVGRVIRSKQDYGLMIFADYRYAHAGKREKLPQWIQSELSPERSNLSTEMAVHLAKRFLKQMAQPMQPEIGKTLLSVEHLRLRQSKRKEAAKSGIDEDVVMDDSSLMQP